jgi:hypothetical protein
MYQKRAKKTYGPRDNMEDLGDRVTGVEDAVGVGDMVVGDASLYTRLLALEKRVQKMEEDARRERGPRSI